MSPMPSNGAPRLGGSDVLVIVCSRFSPISPQLNRRPAFIPSSFCRNVEEHWQASNGTVGETNGAE
jgi:hypothetical protein